MTYNNLIVINMILNGENRFVHALANQFSRVWRRIFRVLKVFRNLNNFYRRVSVLVVYDFWRE
jgi:hypothetical protein